MQPSPFTQQPMTLLPGCWSGAVEPSVGLAAKSRQRGLKAASEVDGVPVSLDQSLLTSAHALVDALGVNVSSVDALDAAPPSAVLSAIDSLGDLARIIDSLGAVLSAHVTHRVQETGTM